MPHRRHWTALLDKLRRLAGVSEAGGPRHARFSRDGVERELAAEILSEAKDLEP